MRECDEQKGKEGKEARAEAKRPADLQVA